MNERVGEFKENIKSLSGRAKEKTKKITLITALGGLGLFAAGCGDEGIRSQEGAEAVALNAYDTTYKKASPAGKFVMQYLRTTEINVLHNNGNMIFNDGNNTYHKFYINNGCLQNTAYDIAGGAIDIDVQASGLFSSAQAKVKGENPTAAAFAYVDSNNPDGLLVKSGHTNSVNLHFEGLNDKSPYMRPVGKSTLDIMETYGCKLGQTVDYEKVSGWGVEPYTSEYIKYTSPEIRPK